MMILSRQPVSEIRICHECATDERIVRRMHYRHNGVWWCETCRPFRVEHEPESAQASAEPPLSADTRDTATQSPPVDQSTQADAQTTGGAAGPSLHVIADDIAIAVAAIDRANRAMARLLAKEAASCPDAK